jgi:ribosome maturation factor RimP
MTEKVKNACEPIVKGLGYNLEKVTYEQEFGVWELTLYISGDNPITHKDCEVVTHAVDDIIEQLDPTDGQSYSLSVSSIGIKGEQK